MLFTCNLSNNYSAQQETEEDVGIPKEQLFLQLINIDHQNIWIFHEAMHTSNKKLLKKICIYTNKK